MAFQRGRFGIEYDPRQSEEPSGGLGWAVAAIAFVALASLAWTIVGRFRSKENDAEIGEILGEGPRPAVVAVGQKPEKTDPPSSGHAISTKPPEPDAAPPGRTLEDSDILKRPVKLRNLLIRLEEAKKRRDIEMEVTTIELIRAMPGSPAADLDDSLARRLGTLNIRRLFELRNAQWVGQVTVKRGDVASRIASENGSTLASFARLNGGNVDKVVLGKKMYVMSHPRFNLVIHRRTRTADLSLNGKFFKRYYIPGKVSGKEGTYEFPASPKAFWRSLGVEFSAADCAEIEMLMPVKASVIVAEL